MLEMFPYANMDFRRRFETTNRINTSFQSLFRQLGRYDGTASFKLLRLLKRSQSIARASTDAFTQITLRSAGEGGGLPPTRKAFGGDQLLPITSITRR
jgi:hypothetical protein